MVRAIHSIRQNQKFYCVLMRMMTDNAIRKLNECYFYKADYIFTITDLCMNKNLISFDGEKYDSVELSKYSHIWTLGLANYKGSALTTGCNSFGECAFKTELLNMTTQKWSEGPVYPFGGREK